jgi:FkbM family methyltransferase
MTDSQPSIVESRNRVALNGPGAQDWLDETQRRAKALGLKKVHGVWLPPDDEHFTQFLEHPDGQVQGVGTYQFHNLRQAVGFCKPRYGAVDVGAHVGLWSMWLARLFKCIHMMEPVPIHFDALKANVAPVAQVFKPEIKGFNCAVGAENGKQIYMRVDDPSSSGGYYIVPDNAPKRDSDIKVNMHTLDRLIQYTPLDFIKIDVQGGELDVIRGGEMVIRRNLPVICIEQRDYEGVNKGKEHAIGLLESWGYQVAMSFDSGDYVMTFGRCHNGQHRIGS